jgi:hypothetical protein
MKKTHIIIAALLIVCCNFLPSYKAAAQKKMTPELISQYGTVSFKSSKDSVFNAVKQTLVSHGYTIDIENVDKGLIKTNRKDIGATGSATYTAYAGVAQYRSNYKQYIATVELQQNGLVKVVMEPKVYVGDADYSDKKVWVIKGNAGEIKLWEDLFKDIQERL